MQSSASVALCNHCSVFINFDILNGNVTLMLNVI